MAIYLLTQLCDGLFSPLRSITTQHLSHSTLIRTRSAPLLWDTSFTHWTDFFYTHTHTYNLSAFVQYLWQTEVGHCVETRNHIYYQLLWNDEVAHLVQIHNLSMACFVLSACRSIMYNNSQPDVAPNSSSHGDTYSSIFSE